MNNDTKTTILGILIAAVMAANVDWSKLFGGDSGEIGKVVTALATAAWGYFTNRGGLK